MNTLFVVVLVATKWVNVARSDSIGSVLSGGEKLQENEWLTSDNGDYRLYMQNDGNLVGYEIDTNIGFWSTGTDDEGTGPYYVKMQHDDNLVLYDDATGDALWSSKTPGDNYSGVYLKLQDDRNIVLLSSNGDLVWESETSIDDDNDDDSDCCIDYEDISVIGTTFSYSGSSTVYIDVPNGAINGDIVLMIIGASDKLPDWPSGNSWNQIINKPIEDINIRACYKEYDGVSSYTVSNGKNMHVSIILLRGVDINDPIVDSDGKHNSVKDDRNNYGVAIAPSINTVNYGIVIAGFMFDDPHESTIINDGYTMLISESKGDDGLAIGVSETDGTKTGEIETIGNGYECCGGHEVTISMSFRPSTTTSGQSSGRSGSGSGSSNGSSKNTDNDNNLAIIILIVVLSVLVLVLGIVVIKRCYFDKKMKDNIEAMSENNDTYEPPSNVSDNKNTNDVEVTLDDGKVY